MKAAIKNWFFLVVPVVALVELGAHAWQLHRVVPPEAWVAARHAVEKKIQPADGLVFAPTWTDPLGRHAFSDLATIAREAPQDYERFPRAFEVSIRGAHAKGLTGWRPLDTETVGPITITLLQNPSPVTIKDDLLSHVSAERMTVSRVEPGKETPCTFTHTTAQSGGLGFGPTVPADRFVCPGGGFAGVSILHSVGHAPRQCLFVPPLGGAAVLRLRFADVAFGDAIHGYHGLQQEDENRGGAPVTLAFQVGDRALGKFTHQDGQGWSSFEMNTTDLSGQRGDVIVDVSTSNAARRHYCFQAETR